MRAAPITALLAASLAVSACGTSAQQEGQVLVQQSCGSCHAFTPGGLSPVVAAPNLYELHTTRAEIVDAVGHGAPGMPRNLAGGDDLNTIVNYLLRENAQ